VKKIAIVGGGASGLLVALNLARKSQDSLHITIVEPRNVLGEGIAYSTQDEGHVLNVPAGRMSAFMDHPEHFMQWMGCDKNTFAPRRAYARYLQETLQSLDLSRINLRHIQDKAISVAQEGAEWKVVVAGGEELFANAVVLAIGHGESFQIPGVGKDLTSKRYLADPWRLTVSAVDGHLIGIGTGLTFIDHALTHIRRNSTNTVTGISRNGLIPEAHLAHRADPLEVPSIARENPEEMRRFIEEADDWRAAQDGIRHQLPDIWHRWSEQMKASFLDHDLRWWNVHRHRLAPEIAEEVRLAIDSGRIRVVKSGVSGVKEIDDGITVELSTGESLKGDALVNCLGYRVAGEESLIETLIASGLAQEGPLGLGVKTDYPRFNLLDGNGRPQENVFVIGPVLFGERFETTAIPELREQADLIAGQLLETI
jgi:uncharacterized NAD(P)/FAD-binding protein YdhS